MYLLNRNVALLHAKKPLEDWINANDPDNPTTLEEINTDLNAYLVPDSADEEAGKKIICDNWEFFFENELSEWFDEEEIWPATRSLKMFTEWFDIRILPVVYDTIEKEIQREEI